jgi:hypothetical protein
MELLVALRRAQPDPALPQHRIEGGIPGEPPARRGLLEAEPESAARLGQRTASLPKCFTYRYSHWNTLQHP